MIFLRLFFEFFKTGLFAVGGGLATIPFLRDMSASTGWFTDADLTTMIAVSESTPGPMGVNMATYVGFRIGSSFGHVTGILGSVVATLGLITPSVIVILIVAGVLDRFRDSRLVDSAFKGLRPASTALIAAAGLGVARNVLLRLGAAGAETELTKLINWPCIVLALAVFFCTQHKKLKKLHPICFIALSAVIGIVFKFAGA